MSRIALTPRKSPSQRRSGVTVDVIIEGAIRVLLEDGYGALTTVRVARRAGVSVGSLYQYFPNKQAVVAEIVRRRAAEIIAVVTRVDTDPESDPASAVSTLIAALLREKRQDLPLARALAPAMAEVEGRRLIMEAARSVVPELAGKLHSATGKPLTARDRSGLAIAVAAIEGALWEAIASDPDAFDSPALHQQLTTILLSALSE